MKTTSQIAKRVREVFLDGKWVANTNYTDLLSKVTWQQANQKVGTFNTIAALTFHVDYYLAGVINVFEGGDLEIRDKYSFDCPPIQSESDWENRVNTLKMNAEKFASHVEKMSEEQLEAVFVDEKYGNYRRSIEGIIEHSYYHLGQVSLLKKLITETA